MQNAIMFEQLLEKTKLSPKIYDEIKIVKAYNVAKNAHEGQTRRSGESYITHPISVAMILVDMGMDSDSIVVALLHDIIEDTVVSELELTDLFGESISCLVEGLTKFQKVVKFRDQFGDVFEEEISREDKEAENVRKLLVATSKDRRVLIIKLADRLHNARTFGALDKEKQLVKARETMHVYAILAHRFGIRAIKEELEDISFKILDPIAYNEITNILNENISEKTRIVDDVKVKLSNYLLEMNFKNARIDYRIKTVYGVYRKMYLQKKNVNDLFAIRIIVNTKDECYEALALLSNFFHIVEGRTKDYIKMPKENGYSSIHVTLVAEQDVPIEVQIRSWQMHEIAEYGIAAHWKYKETQQSNEPGSARLINNSDWINNLVENQNAINDSEEIMQTLKTDLSLDEVVVQTPKGKIISLPAGSIVIDFAYAIHTEIGHKMVGARINGVSASTTAQLDNGAVVEIITLDEAYVKPKREWINLVKTTQARNKIRLWFKNECREENISKGLVEIVNAFERNHINISKDDREKLLMSLGEFRRYSSVDEAMAAVGNGEIQISRLIHKIKEAYTRQYHPMQFANRLEHEIIRHKERRKLNSILVDDLNNCEAKLAKCCNPLPGDEIIGFLTRGYGVSVHTKNCTNFINSGGDKQERWVNVSWNKDSKELFPTTIKIIAEKRDKLLADINSAFIDMNLPIESLVGKNDINVDRSYIEVKTRLKDLDQLNKLKNHFNLIKGVISIERVLQ